MTAPTLSHVPSPGIVGPGWAPRLKALVVGGAAMVLLGGIALLAIFGSDAGLRTNLPSRALAPNPQAWFGTDALGRDVFTRTIQGLLVSLQVGLTAALGATLVATVLGCVAALSRWGDRVIGTLIDLVSALPHLVLLVLLVLALGGGREGVILAVALSHWPSLARLVRAEMKAVSTADYVTAARALGRSRFRIALDHGLPHLLPQILIGGLLLFPHAVMHEAALSFLGFGLSPHEPAIGILLAESLTALTAGLWWTAVMPGLALVILVLAFSAATRGLAVLVDPHRHVTG